MTDLSRIEKRLADVPVLYRGIYKKAMSGQSRTAAVHAFCLECVGWQREEVKLCTSPACPLFLYRPYQADGLATESTNEDETLPIHPLEITEV